MSRRRSLNVFLILLALFLLGTVVVLSTVTYYLAIDPSAYVTELEIPLLNGTARWNATWHGQVERIPRIIHQTWKTENIPPEWRPVAQGCRDIMPDYEYKLWTNASSRKFIETHYPWFLDTFDQYPYDIQRADAIRYFVLHHYGGVYVDLDVGCLRALDQLLVYPVILPKTIPVGVSNDLMFAEKGHPFLEQTIHNLVTFDHSWILNYPTVMFSTGPMFLSIQYGLFNSHHTDATGGEIRILPKSLYGKNAKEGEAPHSFFSHFYGSSWHADDAAFIGFLGSSGKKLMWIGLLILIVGVTRTMLRNGKKRRYGLGRIRRYEILLPRWSHRTGSWHWGWSTLPANGPSHSQPFPSEGSDSDEEEGSDILPFDLPPPSPTSTDSTESNFPLAGNSATQTFYDTVQHVRNRVISLAGGRVETPRSPVRTRRRHSSRGIMFLPAFFSTQPQDIELGPASSSSIPHPPTPPPLSAPRWPPEKRTCTLDAEGPDHLYGDLLEEDLPDSRSHTPRPLIDFDCNLAPVRSRSTTRR